MVNQGSGGMDGVTGDAGKIGVLNWITQAQDRVARGRELENVEALSGL